MEYNPSDMLLTDQEPPAQAGLPLVSLLAGLFIVGAITIGPTPPWNWVIEGMGVILAISFVVRSLRTSIRPSPEMLLYLGWVLWASLGILVAIYTAGFMELFFTVVQIWFFIVIITGFTDSRRSLSVHAIAFLIGAGIVAGVSIASGEYAVAETGDQRLKGLALNANAFGWLMLLAVVLLAYLWMVVKARPWNYAILGGGMAIASVSIMLSGSRTAIIGVGVFYVGWLLFSYRKEVFRRPLVACAVILGVIGASLVYNVVKTTDKADRMGGMWGSIMGGASHEGSADERVGQFSQAWTVLSRNLFLGVGLSCYHFNDSYGLTGHSEYINIFTETGLPGAVLYFSIFVVMWRRAGKIAKYSTDPTDVKIAGLVKALVITIAVINFGRWNFFDKAAWIVYGSFIGYTNIVWLGIKERLAMPEQPDQPEQIEIYSETA